MTKWPTPIKCRLCAEKIVHFAPGGEIWICPKTNKVVWPPDWGSLINTRP